MIKKENRFDEYAYRVSTRKLASTVTALEEGQFVTINSDGELEIADGTTKAFMAMSSLRTGRDNVAGGRNCTYLMGNLEVTIDQFDDTETYTAMAPLIVGADGVLTVVPAVPSGDEIIEAYAVGAVVDGFLRVIVI